MSNNFYNKTISIGSDKLGILTDTLIKEFPYIKNGGIKVVITYDADLKCINIKGTSEEALEKAGVDPMWSGVSIEDVRNAAVDILVDNQKYRRYKCIWYKAEKAIMGKLGGSCIGCIFSSKDSGCWCLDMHDRLCESSQRVNNDCIVWKKMSTNEINDVLVMLEKGQIH